MNSLSRRVFDANNATLDVSSRVALINPAWRGPLITSTYMEFPMGRYLFNLCQSAYIYTSNVHFFCDKTNLMGAFLQFSLLYCPKVKIYSFLTYRKLMFLPRKTLQFTSQGTTIANPANKHHSHYFSRRNITENSVF